MVKAVIPKLRIIEAGVHEQYLRLYLFSKCQDAWL